MFDHITVIYEIYHIIILIRKKTDKPSLCGFIGLFDRILFYGVLFIYYLPLEYLRKIQKKIQLLPKLLIFLLNGQAVYFFRSLRCGEDEVIGI